MYVQIEVTRILGGVHACHVASSLKFQMNSSPHRNLPTEEKKYQKENKGIDFYVKIQRGIALQILDENDALQRGFVCLNTSIICAGEVCNVLNF